ncbi:nitrate- and nitrite sensing domain-containing protein [Saccharopolyspora sp. K220]|uniref:sensor histidine kinase n=1 Tax=Saccharopolyspora soli TaxID=2926618 RepID=UPI001F5688AA|nr:nitrate- and nitrite sensing domain-containing protein [Saccharopolyspora soli]MCI2415802.1 nitrate- and nitrite sensing domain-containing protein [Saccharopolyspora soli]
MKSTTETDYRTIRSRLTRLVVAPSVILLLMWLVFSSYEISDGFYVREVAVEVQDASIPAVQSLVAIQKERQLTMRTVMGSGADVAALDKQRGETDQAVAALTEKLSSLSASESTPLEVKAQVGILLGLLDDLPQERAQARLGPTAKDEIYRYYNSLLDAGAALFDTQARIVPDAEAGQAGITATEIFRAADQMSRVASLGDGALVSGQLSQDEYLDFVHLVGTYHGRLSTVMPFASADVQNRYGQVIGTSDWQRVTDFENSLLMRGALSRGSFPISEQDWRSSADRIASQLIDLAKAQAEHGAALGMANGNARFTAVVVGSLVALLAVLIGIGFALRSSRKLVDRALVTRLADLKDAVLRLAHERLPEIMSRLERGERVNVESELPQLDFGPDEIGQVADAFNVAQNAAVQAAVQESQAREGIKKVFAGIAGRHQALTRRALEAIDGVEREEKDPDRFAKLLLIDNLTTQQQRHAENMSILADRKPGRQYRNPVSLVDILYSAAGEVEDYPRIHIGPVPHVAVKGAAVTDTIHVLAELIDNATTFSPPHEQVWIRTHGTGNGVVVEIEDGGLGMSEEGLATANAMLVDPPDFTAFTMQGNARLGLFVIARLARRRGTAVTLRAAEKGGVVATVQLPQDIVLAGSDWKAAAPHGTRRRAVADPAPHEAATSRQRSASARPATPASESAVGEADAPSADVDAELPRRRRGKNLRGRTASPDPEVDNDQRPPQPSTRAYAFYRGARRGQGDRPESPNHEG